MKKTIIKLSIITLISCLLSSCILMTEDEKDFWTVEGQARLAKRDADEKLRRSAEQDAINLQRFPNLPTCQGYVSPNWTKVAYDEKQGYCILRPETKPVFKKIDSCKGLKAGEESNSFQRNADGQCILKRKAPIKR